MWPWFGSVTVRAWNGLSGSGFQFRRLLGGKTFLCISVQFKGMARFRFRFLKDGSSGSASGLCSGFRFQFQKISQISLLPDFRVFLDIFEIFAEDCFLLRSFQKFLPSGFVPLSRFQFLGPKCACKICSPNWFWRFPGYSLLIFGYFLRLPISQGVQIFWSVQPFASYNLRGSQDALCHCQRTSSNCKQKAPVQNSLQT